MSTCTNRTPDEWQCWCCPGRSSVRFDTATTTGRTNVPRLQHKLVCQCRVHAKRRKSASSNTSRATSNHKHPTTHNPTLPHHPLPNQLFAVVDCNANKSNRVASLSNDKSMVEETGSNYKMSSVTKKYPLCVSKHCFKCNSEREANTTPHSLHKRRMGDGPQRQFAQRVETYTFQGQQVKVVVFHPPQCQFNHVAVGVVKEQ